jgi:hypothetical protein
VATGAAEEMAAVIAVVAVAVEIAAVVRTTNNFS